MILGGWALSGAWNIILSLLHTASMEKWMKVFFHRKTFCRDVKNGGCFFQNSHG
jgi:hypothetical protein